MATKNLFQADAATIRRALRQTHETLNWVANGARITAEERKALKVVLRLIALMGRIK